VFDLGGERNGATSRKVIDPPPCAIPQKIRGPAPRAAKRLAVISRGPCTESNARPSASSPSLSCSGHNLRMAGMRMIEAVRAAIAEEMERDDRVLILGEDVGLKGGVFGVTDGLYARFGASRVLHTPLAESAIVGVAIGAALNCLIPIADHQ